MAEIIIQLGPGGGYEDGDVRSAANDRRIQQCHAETICHPWKITPNGDGWLPRNCLAEMFLAAGSQYCFERMSETEIDRVTIATGVRERLSDKPNAKGEAIHVVEYLDRRRNSKARNGSSKMPIFGSEGGEVWYGGCTNFDLAKLAGVWDAIESRTPLRRANFTSLCSGPQKFKQELLLPAVDFTDEEAGALVAPQMDNTDPENPVMIAKRNMRAEWRNPEILNLLGVTEAAMLDRKTAIPRIPGMAALQNLQLLWNKAEQRYAKRLA